MMPAARTAARKSGRPRLRYYRAGAGRRGQAYGDDGSNGTDENLAKHASFPFTPCSWYRGIGSLR